MSGIPILPRFRKAKKKTKPAPLTRRQSFNGEVKAPGQPPSPLIQQVSRKKDRLEEPPGVPLHAKSASLSSLLVNSEEAAATGMVNGLTELCSSSNSVPLDRQSIIDIQKDIQPFTVSTTKLRETISKVKTGDDEMRLKLQPVVVNCIEDLNRVVNNILTTYPEVSSTCIKSSLATLMESSKSWKQTTQGIVTWCRHCEDALNTLLDAFTKSVEGYMADSLPDTQQLSGSNTNISRTFTSPTTSFKGSSNMMKGHYSKSAENLSAYQYHEMQQDRELTADIDKALLCTENAVEVALENSKTRSKYIREITNYMNKRAQIVADYDRQMSKLNKSVREVLPDLATESGESLPLLGVFQQCLDEDVNFTRMNNATFNLHVTQKLVEPMEKRNSECIKRKKDLKEMWSREQKKLLDCKAALKAAKSKYTMLGQELARLKAIQMQKDEVGHKQEKRKKEITDLEAKRIEAETAYKQAVANANDCQYQVHISQKSILCAFRLMVMELDQILKDSFESHFELQHHFFDQFPQRFMALQDQVEVFEPGRDFYHHIIRQPQLKDEPIEFVFEEFDPDADLQVFKAAGSSSDLVEHDGVEFHTSVDSGLQSCDTDSPMFGRRLGSPVSAWESYQVPIHSSHSPQHSTASSSNVSVTATPTISPGVSVEMQSLSTQQPQQQPLSNSQPPNSKATRRLGTKRNNRPVSMANVFDHTNLDPPSTNSSSGQRRVSATADIQETCSVKSSTSMSDFNNAVMSKSARTHRFKKADDPNRCRECDNNVYFHGVECEVCGLTCHQKCLEFLMIKCGNKKLQRRIRTFGVDFRKHLEVTHCNIPIIVTKCINELDERGLSAKGIYRLSGAKTKMEKLCRLFEVGGDRVDISDQSPHQIASCLKLYFRQLPEPLLTYALYDEFITCAKNAGKILPVGDEQVEDEVKEMERSMISRLHELLTQLDAQHYLTLARLLFHLHRVHQNHRFNSMPASNLGIVFGPNLLQPKETQSSFMAIKEMTYQAKVIELLIHYAHDVLNITEDKVREEENAEDDMGTVEAYIPIEQCSEYSYNSAVDEKMETRTTISDALDLDDESSNYKLFESSNMEELLHTLYHCARQRLGDEMPLVPKSKSVSPDNEDFEEDSSVLPGSVGSESGSLLSLQTPRSSLPPVEERLEHRMPEYKDDEWDKDKNHNPMHHSVPKCHFPLSSMHSRSTPHLFVDVDNSHLQNKSRSSVPSIGMDTETESGFGSNKGISEQSLNNSSDFEDSQTDSDPEFGDDNDELSLPDGSVMSPTNESTQSTPRKCSTLSVTARQRKSSSFKRDWAGRQVIAKRAVSLHIPRNKDNVSIRKPLYKSDSNYLSSSLSQLQHFGESSPSPVSLDRYTSGAASSHSDRAYNSETNSPWSTPLHRMNHDPTTGATHFHDEVCDHMIPVSVPDNHITDDAVLCNNHHTLPTNDNTVTNDRLHRLSTLVSEDLPEGEEKAAREQNTTENDKEMALENQIRREFKKVDSIGERLCYLYNDADTGNPLPNQSPTSEDGISIHEVKLDVRSLSPLSENSVEDGPCGRNMPYHSSSNSTSSAEMHFIHKQHDSTASEQSMDAQNKPINHDQLALHSSLPDRIPPSPQRYRRLLAITPSLQKLSLSRSTSDVSNDVKNKEKHASASPKGSGFKFSLKRKSSLVLPDGRENTSRSLSLSRDKSKSTNELYSAKDKSRTTSIFSGLPIFRKTKSNGRSKQLDNITSSSGGSPKSKRKKSRAPQYV